MLSQKLHEIVRLTTLYGTTRVVEARKTELYVLLTRFGNY